MDVEHTLEVEAGRAQPSTIGLSPGEPVGPLSIGRMGGWRVAANGVAAEHGYLYFDGRDLWLQSLDPAAPMFADGVALPVAWTAIRAPCEIVLGAARIRFAETEVEVERTADRFPAPRTAGVAAPPQPPSQPAPPPSQRLRRENPFAPGELARPPEDHDSTRMGPLDVAAARARSAALGAARPSVPRAHMDSEVEHPTTVGRGAPALERPATPSGALAPTSSRASGPPEPDPASHHAASHHAASHHAASHGAPRELLDEKPTEVRPLPRPGGLMGAWNAASFPQKVTLFLLPLALGSVYVIFTDPPEPLDEGPTSTVASGASSTASSPTASSPTSATIASSSPAPRSSIVNAAPPEPPVAASATPLASAASAPPSRSNVDAEPVEAAPAAPVTTRKGVAQRTLERRAADSVAAGDWEGAAELYAQLAREHPETKAFAEAARILRAKP